MARNKHPEYEEATVAETPSPFPEGYIMHQYDHTKHAESALEAGRNRHQDARPINKYAFDHSAFYLHPTWTIPGYQLAWIVERVLNDPNVDNLEKAYNRGWRAVKKSECHWLSGDDYPDYLVQGREDEYVRKCGQMLHKMPIEMFEEMNERRRLEGEEIRRQSNELTAYMGDTSGPVVRKVYENTSSYQPSYRHK